MIRFRNPVSNIDIIIDVFKKMYLEFSDVEYFDLDNIAEFFAREKIASSSGYTGDEALRRSYSVTDDSKKSMKMQSKSYAELYRFLGWLYSDSDAALKFNFTFIGVHVAVSGNASKKLFEQCLLGVNYPNHILDVKFSDFNKPFVNMLLFAEKLDGKLHRDEILLGPMNLENGYSNKEIEEKVLLIKQIRSTHSLEELELNIANLADNNSMAPESVRNLTRFPISSLVYTGWFEKKKLDIYHYPRIFLVLTNKGQSALTQIHQSIDLNGENIKQFPYDKKKLCELSLLHMFESAGFQVQEELDKHTHLINALFSDYGKNELLFSPYQYFSKNELLEIFPNHIQETSSSRKEISMDTLDTNEMACFLSGEIFESGKPKMSTLPSLKTDLIQKLAANNNNIDTVIAIYLRDICKMKQQDFYPFISDLLSIIFDRNVFSPAQGNNNMRFDLMIPDDFFSIPVEVKSPTEELMLSVKAIRQAVENKVILLSRKPYNTSYEISSFAIGFQIPNNRSDVYRLIKDIYSTYEINIAIMDVRILLTAALNCIKSDICYDVSGFKNIRGVIDFEL